MAPRRRGAGRALRANPRDPDGAIRYRRRYVRSASAPKPPRCWRPRRCIIRSTGRRSAPIGRALADAGNYKQALSVLDARIRPISPTGASFRCRAPCSIRWAGTRRHSAIASALRIVPEEPSVLSNLGLSLCAREGSERTEVTLRCGRGPGQRRQARAARDLALVVGLRGRFQGRPRPSRRPTCRRIRRPRTSAICAA